MSHHPYEGPTRYLRCNRLFIGVNRLFRRSEGNVTPSVCGPHSFPSPYRARIGVNRLFRGVNRVFRGVNRLFRSVNRVFRGVNRLFLTFTVRLVR